MNLFTLILMTKELLKHLKIFRMHLMVLSSSIQYNCTNYKSNLRHTLIELKSLFFQTFNGMSGLKFVSYPAQS